MSETTNFTVGQRVTFNVGGKLLGALGVIVTTTPERGRIQVKRINADGSDHPGGIYRPFAASVKV